MLKCEKSLMPISISSGGSGKPWLRFSAQLDQWQTSSADGSTRVVTPRQLAIDVERMQLGWLELGAGTRTWTPWPGNKKIASPGGEAKVGVAVDVLSPSAFGDRVLREICSNAVATTRFVEAVYNQTEAEHGKGLVPLVEITGSTPVKIGKGATRDIVWKLIKMMPRPAEMSGAPAAAPAAPAPAPTPPPAPRPAPAATSDDEF
jgi:hypothetical protein